MQASRFKHFNPDCTRDDFTLVTKGLETWAVIFDGREVTSGKFWTIQKWLDIVTRKETTT
jgi:hypothetical protein